MLSEIFLKFTIILKASVVFAWYGLEDTLLADAVLV